MADLSAKAGRERRDSLLRQPAVAALLAAETISTTGSQMSALALPWFVLVTTGSPARMSFVVAAELIGLGALGLPGGRLLRRLGARRTMLICDGFRGPLMALIPVLYWSGALTFAGLLAASFALGALTTPYFSAQKVIVPELLGEDESVVSRASALFQAAQRVTLLLGPVAGGILISVFSAPAVLLFDAGSYAAALVLVALFVPHRPPLRGDEAVGVPQGIRFLAGEPLLRAWIPLFAVGDTAWTAFFLSVPVLVVARFGSDARIAGWLLASFGVGALIGNAISYRVLLERVRGLSVVAAFVLVQAVPLWLLVPKFPAAVYSAALVASGMGNGLVNPSIHALMTLRIPAALRPSAMTVMGLLYGLLNPIGVFVTGPVLAAFGTRPVFVAFAVLQTACMSGVALASLRVRDAEAPALSTARAT